MLHESHFSFVSAHEMEKVPLRLPALGNILFRSDSVGPGLIDSSRCHSYVQVTREEIGLEEINQCERRLFTRVISGDADYGDESRRVGIIVGRKLQNDNVSVQGSESFQISEFIRRPPAFSRCISDNNWPNEVVLEIALQYLRIDFFLINSHSSIHDAVAHYNHSEFIGTGFQWRKIISSHAVLIYRESVMETVVRF